MKILTINVHGWMEENTEQKIKYLAKTIAQKDYEIVALQEVNQPMKQKEVTHPRFIKSINESNSIPLKEQNYAGLVIQELEKLGKEYYWSWSANHIGYDKYDEGLSILSKTPQKTEAIIVSETTDYSSISTRNVLKSEVNIEGEKWHVFNGHFSWWEDDKKSLVFKNEWDKVQEYFKDINVEHVLFMGDFNNEADRVEEGYDYLLETTPFLSDTYKMAEKRYGDATIVAGIDGWNHTLLGKRIDYIFSSKRLPVLESNVIFDGKNESVISDHFGVEVILGN